MAHTGEPEAAVAVGIDRRPAWEVAAENSWGRRRLLRGHSVARYFFAVAVALAAPAGTLSPVHPSRLTPKASSIEAATKIDE